jgi:hypothetical protein
MKSSLFEYLSDIAQNEGVDISGAPNCLAAFGNLIRRLYRKHDEKKVAILIDDYDAPIAQNLRNPVLAEAIRWPLCNFFNALKAYSVEVGHIFMTGVGRFNLTTGLSGPIPLYDLTYNSHFADICGFNCAELDGLLDERLADMLEALTKKGLLKHGNGREDVKDLVLDWYGGHSWDGEVKVLNPWSVLSFFNERDVGSFWHDSKTSFLTELSTDDKQRILFRVESPMLNDDDYAPIFSNFDFFIDAIEHIDPNILLFQTGYLTIKEMIPAENDPDSFRLGPPNLEVKAALEPLMLSVEPADHPFLER